MERKTLSIYILFFFAIASVLSCGQLHHELWKSLSARSQWMLSVLSDPKIMIFFPVLYRVVERKIKSKKKPVLLPAVLIHSC
jgi:hypothetical protein